MKSRTENYGASFTINSKKIGKPVTFFWWGYIWADLNGKEGILGSQLTKDNGCALHADTEEEFEKEARKWWRSYIKEAV